eukprot:5736119-Pyramimonas_sp.AAC.1
MFLFNDGCCCSISYSALRRRVVSRLVLSDNDMLMFAKCCSLRCGEFTTDRMSCPAIAYLINAGILDGVVSNWLPHESNGGKYEM